MANPYKTHWYNRQAAHWLRKSPEREAGQTEQPECIRLAPEDGVEPSSKAPVRIFLGTEPGQYRATRVFVWSVMKTRDPAREYEIFLMSDLAGIERVGWKTGFTNYRYAIPALAGQTGRAIYNDVDQIYLSDPALLFDHEMDGKGILAISEKENSVMLIDCDLMAEHWTLEDVAAGKGHAHFKGVVSEHGLFGEMPGTWNSRDGEFPIEETDCLHYTTLHTQPWRPFPDLLRYGPNPLGYVWHDLEREADDAGYLLFTRVYPTQESLALIEQYQLMHEGGAAAAEANPDTPQPFQGGSLVKHFDRIAKLAEGASTILDYGAGKAGGHTLAEGESPDQPMRINTAWPGVRVHCYDPGHEPFAVLPDEQFDGVISTDVVEHLAPFDVPWVLDEIFAAARKFVYVVAACYPAKKVLPNGRNAHTTLQPPYWWQMQMQLAARRYPDIAWVLVAETRPVAGLGKSRSIYDRTSPSVLD